MITHGNIEGIGRIIKNINGSSYLRSEIEANSSFWNVDVKFILDSLLRLKIINLTDEKISMNKYQDNLLSLSAYEISKEILKRLLAEEHTEYMQWLPMINQGEKKAIRHIPTDIFQCIEYYGLFDMDIDNILWKIDICGTPEFDSRFKNKIGRIGEYLSYLYESHRIKRDPVWTSVKINTKSPYDIKSSISAIDTTETFIEVKSSVAKRCILTKHEWIFLATNKNSKIHIWDLSNRKKIKLAIINNPLELEEKEIVPKDMKRSNWGQTDFEFEFSQKCILLSGADSKIGINTSEIIEDFPFDLNDIEALISEAEKA